MKLTVNGTELEHRGRGTILEVVTEAGAKPENVAVVLGGEVVPRVKWATVELREGDKVDIMAFMGGG